MALIVYELNWENKSGDREYFWSSWESAADARANGPWEVAFPARATRRELEDYANSNWALPCNEEEVEDLRNFTGIAAPLGTFLGEK